MFLPQEVQPWEGSEEEEGEDLDELRLKAEEDAEDEAYTAFIGAASRHRRRHRAFQVGFDSSTVASNYLDSNLMESDSSIDSNFRDDEVEEEEEEEDEDEEEEKEEYMALDYPKEDSNWGRDLDACKLRSPKTARFNPAIFFCFYR